MLERDEPLRELRLALPGDTDDLYVRHQQVWAALRTQVDEGRDFLYRLTASRIALVRSACLRQGIVVSDLPPAHIALDLVAADREDGNKERPVPIARVADWSARLLRQHGLEPSDVQLLRHGEAVGVKAARFDAPGHRIRYATATITADVRISDLRLARSAWRLGVGRGRRFGFGMLVAG